MQALLSEAIKPPRLSIATAAFVAFVVGWTFGYAADKAEDVDMLMMRAVQTAATCRATDIRTMWHKAETLVSKRRREFRLNDKLRVIEYAMDLMDTANCKV